MKDLQIIELLDVGIAKLLEKDKWLLEHDLSEQSIPTNWLNIFNRYFLTST